MSIPDVKSSTTSLQTEEEVTKRGRKPPYRLKFEKTKDFVINRRGYKEGSKPPIKILHVSLNSRKLTKTRKLVSVVCFCKRQLKEISF